MGAEHTYNAKVKKNADLIADNEKLKKKLEAEKQLAKAVDEHMQCGLLSPSFEGTYGNMLKALCIFEMMEKL
jgi:hypothetical protein